MSARLRGRTRRATAPVEAWFYLVNLGAIPLHVWSSRFADLARPDWAILDLEARGLPCSQAVEVARRPSIASIARSPSAREGKVYVDFLQNGHGKLLVAPFAVRPRPGAPVSTPLHWLETERDFLPEVFHLKNVPERVAQQKADPWAGLFGSAPDLGKVLGRLAREAG